MDAILTVARIAPVTRFFPFAGLLLILVCAGGSLRAEENDAYEVIDRELLKEDDEETRPAAQDDAASGTTSGAGEAVELPGETLEEPAGEPVTAQEDADADALDSAYAALQNQEYDIAYDLFYTFASGDNAQAQYELAALYHRGAGVEADIARAARWYARAAELGYADAQYRLGNMFLMGEGMRQSDSEAVHWYEQAAQQGHADAKSNLASLRRISSAKTRQELEQEAASLPPLEVERRPEPGEKPKKRGFFKRWFGKDKKTEPAVTAGTEVSESQPPASEASAAPDTTAPPTAPVARPAPLANSTAVSNYELGLAYALGDTLEQDQEQAFEYFRKSAQEGYAPAQYRLGAAYANADGTEQDPAQALEWYRKSALQGHIPAQRSLALVYLNGLEDLTPDKPLALAWYTLLAEDGNQMDLHRRDSLLEELPEEDVDRAEELADEMREELAGTTESQ